MGLRYSTLRAFPPMPPIAFFVVALARPPILRLKPLILLEIQYRITVIMLNKWQKWPYLAAYAL